MPARLVRPTVGLIPTTPLALAGQTMLPSVSVPNDTAAKFDETAAAAASIGQVHRATWHDGREVAGFNGSGAAPRTLDLDLIAFGRQVLEAPGHSIGHIVLLCKQVQPWRLFGGDVLFAGSIGRTATRACSRGRVSM